jgi:hypothetical protein
MLAPRQTPSTLPRPRSDCVEFDVHTSSPHQTPSQDAALPPWDSGPHAFGGTHQSGGLLATSFGGLHPFTSLSNHHPLGRPFLFFRVFLFCIRNFHVQCSRTQPHFWECTSSACIIHLCSVFARPPPFSYCISFLRISLFSSYVHLYVLSLWRDIRSLLLPSSRTIGFPLTSLPAASKIGAIYL